MAPKFYRPRFIEPGIVSYEDSNAGVVLVSHEALDRMAPTFRGCPVILTPEHHNDADKENVYDPNNPAAQSKVGIVTGNPEWGDDGWQYVDLVVEDEEAQAALDEAIAEYEQGKESKWSVSCAYDVTEEKEGGTWHSIPYDAEMENGQYKHMAIVPRPRYEGSKILANSKGGHSVAIKLFGKKENAAPVAPPIPPKKPEAAHPEPDADNKPTMVNDDTEVDVNGTPVPLHELIAKYMESQGAGTPAALGDADEVELPDGTKVTVADLKAAYTGGAGAGEPDADNLMQNAEAPTDAPAEPVVDTSKQGSTRTNSAPVRRTVNLALRNAAAQPGESAGEDHPETRTERLDRGASRYSKAVPQGGK